MLRIWKASISEFTLSRSTRGIFGAAIPLLIALHTDQLKNGLWVFMAVVLLLTSEKPLSYPQRIRFAVASSLIGLIGFGIGALVPGAGVSIFRDLILVLAMGVVSFSAGYISGFGPSWSAGSVTLLMLASTSMDEDAISTHWNAALWFLVGLGVYVVMLLVEWAIMRDYPQRYALSTTYSALRSYSTTVQAEIATGNPSPLSPLPLSPTIADPATKARRDVRETSATAATCIRGTRWSALGSSIIDQVSDQTAEVTTARFLPKDLSGVSLPEISRDADDDSKNILNPKLVKSPARGPRTESHTDWSSLWHYITHPTKDSVMRGVRLSLCMMVAVIVHRFVDTPHSYWIVVAVALIAKPDAGSVYARAIQRSLGVLGGVGIGWAIFHFAPGNKGQVIAIIILIAISPVVKQYGYTAQSMIFTPIMLVFTNVILPEGVSSTYGPERVAATALGAAIVIVFGFAIWPRTREPRIIPLAHKGRLTVGSFLRHLSKEDAPADELDRLRNSALRAEDSFRSQLARSLTEPSTVSTQASMWSPTSASLERLIDLATAATALPHDDSFRDSMRRAYRAALPGDHPDSVPGNVPVSPLPAAPTSAEAELLRGIVTVATSLQTLSPPEEEAELVVKNY